MSVFDNVEGVSRKVIVLFFLVDASSSMSGEKIGAVNTALREFIPEIHRISAENADVQIKIAVMEFSSGARWITMNGPVEVEKFIWQDINASGVADMGEACRQLAKKLSVEEGGFLCELTSFYAPVIFLHSNCEPTDDFDNGFTELQQNKLFKAAIKIALAIGDNANTELLAKFTGNKEAVLCVHTPEVLARIIESVIDPHAYDGPVYEHTDINKEIVHWALRRAGVMTEDDTLDIPAISTDSDSGPDDEW